MHMCNIEFSKHYSLIRFSKGTIDKIITVPQINGIYSVGYGMIMANDI